MSDDDNTYGTVKDACRVIGGTRPVSAATYYRGVNAGRYPPPVHPSPGISRVNLTLLRRMIWPTSQSTDTVEAA